MAKRKLSKKDWIGIFGFIILFIIIFSVLIFYFKERQKIVQVDEEFCPEVIDNVSVVLIDQSDQFNIVQKTAVNNIVRDIVKSLLKYERIEIFLMNSNTDVLQKPIFSFCNPGQGLDESDFSGNKRLKKYNWEKKFYTPFSNALNSILLEKKAKSSPIMDAIQSISLTSLHKYKNAAVKFYIISDMLQHSVSYSNYKYPLDFKSFKAMGVFNRLRVDFDSVDIRIFYVNRDSKKQGKSHILFWEDYFNEMGGILSSVKRVEG